ncbi:MAG: LytTR family DNA-binding domain-containing protein [Marinilabiliaceae bacterium]|jgi:DNA-binding LytR/AlgR family response regulator|nr:LytTR family DNA-binding domain-containing protein [Marinilabiliaceae bacterium]
MKLRCIAIDDEPLALEIISDYISKVPFLELIETFDNALDSIDFIKREEPELMFLDIQMESFTGIQLVQSLNKRPEVIFTTAHDNYAVEGFELNAADYLMKPISFERFVKAVDKVYNKLRPLPEKRKYSEVTISNPSEKYFFVKTENRLQKVFFDDILWVEGQGDYLRIISVKEKIMTLQNFKTLSSILPEKNFIRVHKSYMVAINKIDSVSRNRISIGKEIIPVSDSYKNHFYDTLREKGMV